jgi:hypothetical protein
MTQQPQGSKPRDVGSAKSNEPASASGQVENLHDENAAMMAWRTDRPVQALIGRCLAGEEKAWSELCRTVEEGALRPVRLLLHRSGVAGLLAEDVMQILLHDPPGR